ncbi:hypothetical protein F2Q68_00040660 [Brassica cretica]|uniref:Uncharacterized protein n=1 Tax=Brassica cretica TaxID=69181 RepID=A0A8S9MHQ8_BRACR|nr:hypothetical protein F2Q68_00040660 [Brassica cretica]
MSVVGFDWNENYVKKDGDDESENAYIDKFIKKVTDEPELQTCKYIGKSNSPPTKSEHNGSHGSRKSDDMELD